VVGYQFSLTRTKNAERVLPGARVRARATKGPSEAAILTHEKLGARRTWGRAIDPHNGQQRERLTATKRGSDLIKHLAPHFRRLIFFVLVFVRPAPRVWALDTLMEHTERE
jgi:hypothetical protein